MAERVLVMDPGERTGWCTAELSEKGIRKVTQGVHPIKDLALAVYNNAEKYDTFVYETWRLYPHMAKKLVGNDMQPSQFIGMIRLIGWLNPRIKLVSQGANLKETGMKVMPPNVRKRLRLSSEQHDKDALMHLSAYWFNNYAGAPK